MILKEIKDIDIGKVVEDNYDLGIFACGYESRSVYIPGLLKKEHIKHSYVIGFKEIKNSTQRLKNDDFYKKSWGADPIITSADNEIPIYSCLNTFFSNGKDSIKIVVDYSSMSRLWYAGIINYLKLLDNKKDITVDFLYAVGKEQLDIDSMLINDILSIPGFEGNWVPFYNSVAIFGLGIDAYASLCVLDKLESNVIYAFLSTRPQNNNYRKIVHDKNEELIKIAKKTFELPLTSVEKTYRHLAEIILPYFEKSNIIMIPMGPKPHILATILLATRFSFINSLRVSCKREKPEDISAEGEIVSTRVEFKTA